MNLKKNVFSYLMWLIYSVVVCMGLWRLSAVLSTVGGYSKLEAASFGIVWLLVCGWAVFFRKQHIENARDSFAKPKNKLPAMTVEILFVVILFAAGIFVRVQKLPGIGAENIYFELAKVAEGQSVPAIVHGAVYLYLELLHMVFVIFGNKAIAGIWLQIGLLLVAGIFLYFAVRKISGAVSALATLAFLMIGPFMIKESMVLSPLLFFLAIYTIVLFLCTFAFGGKKNPAIRFLMGILAGAVCYLDVAGITLLVFLFCGILLDVDEEGPLLPIRMVSSVLSLLGGVVGFVILIATDAVFSVNGFFDILLAWLKVYQPTGFGIPQFFRLTQISAEQVILLLMLTIGVMGFWLHRKTEKLSIWVMPMMAFFLLSCFGMPTKEMNGNLHFFLLFSILAGVSLSDIISLGDETKAPKVKAEHQTRKNRQTETVVEESADEGSDDKEQNLSEEITEDIVKETVVETPAEETSAEETATEETPEVPKRKVALLENPLPLPKPHVKKTLDYDIVDIHPTQNCYDIRVADDDDYDVK